MTGELVQEIQDLLHQATLHMRSTEEAAWEDLAKDVELVQEFITRQFEWERR